MRVRASIKTARPRPRIRSKLESGAPLKGSALELPFAPVPKGQRPPASQVAKNGRSALAVRAVEASDYKDGLDFVAATLKRIERLSKTQPTTVVFDLDNTAFECRARTRAIAQAFDGGRWFKDLSLDAVGFDGKELCDRRQPPLPDVVRTAFIAYWEKEFWSGEQFGEDLAIAWIVELAQRAKAAGAEVRYLTGRIDALRGPTLAQLQAAGLPDADDAHLFMKPDLSVHTMDYKSDQLRAWRKAGIWVGWFATEGRRDLAELQRQARAHRERPFRALWLPHALEREGVPLPKHTALLPESCCDRLFSIKERFLEIRSSTLRSGSAALVLPPG